MSKRSAEPRRGGASALLAVALVCLFAAPGLAQTGRAQTDPPTTALDPAELENRAEQRYAEGDLETAVTLYRALAERVVGDEKGRVLLLTAWLEHQTRRDGAALDTLLDALTAAPNLTFRAENYDPAFVELHRVAYGRVSALRERRAADKVHQATEHLRARRLDAARTLFEEALAVDPGHPTALYNLGLTELYAANDTAALAAFERLLAKAQTDDHIDADLHARAWANVGFLHGRGGHLEDAVTAYEQAVANDPAHDAAWNNLGNLRRRAGDLDGALTAYERVHALRPDDPDAVARLASLRIERGEWASAAELLDAATRRFPDNPELWYHLGRAELERGDAQRAMNSFETAIARDPDNVGGWASAATDYLTRHFLAAGDAERALEKADRLLAWERGNPDAWVQRGLAQRALGELDAARTSFETARGLAPDRADIAALLDGSPAPTTPQPSPTPSPTAQPTTAQPSTVPSPTAPPTIAPPPAAEPERPRLGLVFSDVDYSALGMSGVLVESVSPRSAAARAGIEANDLLLKIGGREIRRQGDVTSVWDVLPPGSTIEIDLLRSNLPRKVQLRADGD